MTVDDPASIQTATLVREQVFEKIRDAIITGEFAPGQRLVERQLCEAMGISRTSVRESLRRLETECLVKFAPRRGLTVARLSRKETIEIFEVRAHLEAILYHRFTELATDREIAKLRKIFSSRPDLPRGDEDAKTLADNVIQRNNAMNNVLAHVMKVVNHEVICTILNQLMARISVLRTKVVSSPGRLEESVGEIKTLLSAIEQRRPKEAAEAIKVCVNNARKAALEHQKY